MWVMLLIFSTPAATLPAAQHSTLQYTRQMEMWSGKVFFLLVVKIFVTVISTMDYISTLFYLRGINIYVIIYLEEEEHDT